jgi:hypothetical protein
MNQYRPLNSHWLASPIEIDGLDALQGELAWFQTTLGLHKVTRYNSFYTNVFREACLPYLPQLTSWLERTKLLTKFQRLLYTQDMTQGSPPHVDTLDPGHCSYSINIPLSNCEGTYTAWYEYADDTKTLTQQTRLYNPTMAATVLPNATYREIHRIETVRPYIVNTTVLHGAVCTNPLRRLVGIRFLPELTTNDLTRLGIDIDLPTHQTPN